MQEAGFAARLTGLALLLLSAGAAKAAPPDVLPLATVDIYLRAAGVTAPWSVEQSHFAHSQQFSPHHWTISAMADRKPLADKLCQSRLVEIDLTDEKGDLAVDSTADQMEYALRPCELAATRDYHEIFGKFDPATLVLDYGTIEAAIRGEKTVKIVFDEDFRAVFHSLRSSDIESVNLDRDGRLEVCFISDVYDTIGAMETVSLEVVHGTPPEVKVDLCGYLEIRPAAK